MTQNELVLLILQEHGGITEWNAVHVYGIYRLSQRIYELRQQGYKIHRHSEKLVLTSGEVKQIAVYTL